MLKLFKALFGAEPVEQGRYPEAVIQEGMQLALEATDVRIRTVPGHEAKLRRAVLATFDHIVTLVDGLSPPLDLSRESYRDEAKIAAFFSSVQHIQQVTREDPQLTDWLSGPEGRVAGELNALLIMQRSERKVLGMELQGEIMRREVAQLAVNFGSHRFLSPAESADESRRRLYRRAYNHILELALGRIVEERNERADLKHQRSLLQQKLKALGDGQWGLDAAKDPPVSAQSIEEDIEQVDRQLLNIGTDDEVLLRHLAILCEVLNNPQGQLWCEPVDLIVDRMGIKQTQAGANHLDLHLQELHGARGGTAVVQRVRVPRWDFPERPDFLAEAERFLI